MFTPFRSVVAKISTGAIFALSLTCLARAQQVPQPGPIATQGRAMAGEGMGTNAITMDRLVPAMLYHLYFEHHAVSRFAVDQTHDPAVKKSAEDMSREAKEAISKLRELTRLPESDKPGMAEDPLRLFHEIAEGHAQMLKQQLGRYHGAEFDQAYVGFQMASRTQAAAQLRVLEKYASPKLRPFIAQRLEVAERNLRRTVKLMAGLSSTRR
jgi:predicted outer membrane protein